MGTVMFWPGMGDPTKRRKTLKFLLITAAIGISVGVVSSTLLGELARNDPLKVCINDRVTSYNISATLELYVDGVQADIPANIGFSEDGCQRTLYTLTSDGAIHASWEEEYPFELGHFLWVWEFPLRDMDQSKSRILVNGAETGDFINTPLIDGRTYTAEFTSKAYDTAKDHDFLPPDQ